MIGGICGSFLVGWQLLLNVQWILADKQAPETGAQVKEVLMFPAQVVGTDLIALTPALYEGGYPENASGEYVVDVAALVLQNTASTGIENARVVLQWEGGSYIYEVDMLPAGGTVLVVDKKRQPFAIHRWTACYGDQRIGEGPWDTGEILSMDEVDMGMIYVTNTTDNKLTDVRIYYKSYLPQEQMYVGGISYCMGISTLDVGEKKALRPFHYANGYSKVVRVVAARRE